MPARTDPVGPDRILVVPSLHSAGLKSRSTHQTWEVSVSCGLTPSIQLPSEGVPSQQAAGHAQSKRAAAVCFPLRSRQRKTRALQDAGQPSPGTMLPPRATAPSVWPREDTEGPCPSSQEETGGNVSHTLPPGAPSIQAGWS